MIQFQNNRSRFAKMSEVLEHNGKIYSLIMKGGGSAIETHIKIYQYDHPEMDYVIKEPNGTGFKYLYGCPKKVPQ